jgi:hypothetical protein
MNIYLRDGKKTHLRYPFDIHYIINTYYSDREVHYNIHTTLYYIVVWLFERVECLSH